MNPLRPVVLLYGLWCLAALGAFAFANSDGYSAFAGAGRPTPQGLTSGPHHK
ncbi:MAG: hypothetical protein ABIO39_04225 [Caulobacteraceae bacterium]